MISISNVSASQAKGYYYEKDPLFPENSAWFGKTAELFGFEPGSEVGKAEFAALLAGLNPRTGEQLIQDSVNGERRAGVDLTLSVPKSYALLSLASGDDRLLDAYQDAVDKTLQYAEENFAQVRRSVDGQKIRVDSGNFAIATFKHSLNRDNAPQLHTHAVLISISERQNDGKFVAIENRSLFENRHLLDHVFKSELAAGARELGYGVTTNEKGDFELAGVPQKIIQAFSSRRQQVLEKADELKASGKVDGLHDAEIRERATLETRENKRFVPENEIRERWDNKLADLGTSKKKSLKTPKPQARMPRLTGRHR